MKSKEKLHRRKYFLGKYVPHPAQKDEIVLRAKKMKRKIPVVLVAVPVKDELPKYNIEVDGLIRYTTYTLKKALEIYDSL